MERRRVMFVAGTLGVGGAEQQLLYMVRVLLDGGHEPVIVTLEGGVFEERLRALDVPVTVLDPGHPVKRLWQLARLVRRTKPDVIQAAHNWVSAYVAVVGRLFRTPAIGALRSDPAGTVDELGRMGRLAIKLPKLVAVNSLVNIEASVGLGAERSRLVHLPNAVDTDRFHPPAEPGSADEPVSIIAIGRLSDRKRFDLYLDAIAELRDEIEAGRATAALIGAGPEQATLESHAASLGLTNLVSMYATPDPRQAYRHADLLLFTSGPGEGMPNVILEAMASAVPVVAFDSGDAAHVVIDGVSGVFIEPHGDTARMAAVARKLIDDRDQLRALGNSARAHVIEHYSLDALASNLDDLHRQAF